MQKASVFAPSLLKKVMESEGPQSYLNSILKFREGKDYAEGYAFLEGFVKSERPLVSNLDRQTEMVVSNISTESIFSNNNKMNEGEGHIETRYVNEFELGEVERVDKSWLQSIAGQGVIELSPLNSLDIQTGEQIVKNGFKGHPGVMSLPKWKLKEVGQDGEGSNTAAVILNGMVNCA